MSLTTVYVISWLERLGENNSKGDRRLEVMKSCRQRKPSTGFSLIIDDGLPQKKWEFYRRRGTTVPWINWENG
ncbi:MAG: hypothetical protein F6K10_10795 [Moorea sp. SIO2B7]|nr:hypothetical protein [Moorena sp. SIO2B7]